MELDKLSVDNYTIKSWSVKYPDYKVDLFKLKINESWNGVTQSETFKENIQKLNEYFSYCLQKTNGTVNIFPYPDLVFASVNITPLTNISLVLLGQDPYHNAITIDGKMIPQGMGLAFSVLPGFTSPPSLKNIFKNLLKYKHITKEPSDGNLLPWAEQGVLLLNTSLTVQHNSPNGHESKWKEITDEFIKFISDNTDHIVFILWGNPSLKKLNLIDKTKHKVIISSHPSPLSCNKPLGSYKSFMETDCFGEANKYLAKHGKEEIVYQYT